MNLFAPVSVTETVIGAPISRLKRPLGMVVMEKFLWPKGGWISSAEGGS